MSKNNKEESWLFLFLALVVLGCYAWLTYYIFCPIVQDILNKLYSMSF